MAEDGWMRIWGGAPAVGALSLAAGRTFPPAPSRVGQHAAIKTATRRSATIRLKDSLSLSRVGQHVAVGVLVL